MRAGNIHYSYCCYSWVVAFALLWQPQQHMTAMVAAFTPTPLARHSCGVLTRQRTSGSNRSRSSSSKTALYTDLKPLANEGEWTAFLDEEYTGLVYYFNGKTGESRWDPPTDTFPQVVLRGSMRRRARQKQEEYVKAAAAQERESNNGGSSSSSNNKPKLFSALLESDPKLFETKVEKTKVVQEERKAKVVPAESISIQKEAVKEKEEPDWFGWLFEDRSAKRKAADTPVTTTTPVAAVEEKPPASPPKLFDNMNTFFTNSKATLLAKKDELLSAVSTPVINTSASTSVSDATQQQQQQTQDVTIPVVEQPVTQLVEVTTTTVEEVAKPGVEPITIDISAFILPHPSKVRWGGEDAIFTKGRTFGVFDGVSGADKLDGVPLYSKTLAEDMKQLIGDQGLDVRQITNLLTEAAKRADESSTGASTAIIGSISEDGFLRVLNLGDSTCIVIRNGKVAGKTREISHYFECPYQLSTDSPDRPKDGTKFNIELLKGDIILMASDGVFDNITEEQVAELVWNGPKPTSIIAKRVAEQARKVSINKKAETPYAKMAQRFGDPDYTEGVGGKLDDISCVVVRYG